jgi:hypothetical protein
MSFLARVVKAMRAPAPLPLIWLAFQTAIAHPIAEIIASVLSAPDQVLAILTRMIMLQFIREGFALSEEVKVCCKFQSLPVF